MSTAGAGEWRIDRISARVALLRGLRKKVFPASRTRCFLFPDFMAFFLL
tara:strand:- start:1062 stop:1208 length:147 start_codon:yes stop_codon:yes gene_type:complete